MIKFSSICLLFCLIVFSCSDKKHKEEAAIKEHDVHATYDTTAVDSFSAGAISVDVARQIRMSSKAYQDSLKKAAARIDSAKKAAAKTKEEAKLTEAEKKKEEDKKAQKNKDKAKESSPAEAAAN